MHQHFRTPRTREELVGFVGMFRSYVMSHFIEPILSEGALERTIPDRPKSKDQRFRTRQP